MWQEAWHVGTFIGLALALLVLVDLVRRAIFSYETVNEHEKGLLYAKGRFVRVLEPGRYRLIRWFSHEKVTKIDMRLRSMPVVGQEILTKDQISLKLSAVLQYRIVDPAAAAHKLENHVDFLHQEIQLALRSLVSGKSIDELFQDRAEMSDYLMKSVAERARAYGIELERAGIRDIILPSEIKSIMSKTVEADKAAKAALITAREEHATTRCQANTARLIQENPMIIRLKELQTIAEMGKGSGNTVILVSNDKIASLLEAVGVPKKEEPGKGI